MGSHCRATVLALLLIPCLWMAMAPWKLEWMTDLRKPLTTSFLPGKYAAILLALLLPTTVAALLTSRLSPRHMRMGWSERQWDLAALAVWAALLVAWHAARIHRFGLVPSGKTLAHVSVTFASTAMINLQLLLLPATRNGLLGSLVGIPSERLNRWHRFLGQATFAFLAVHALLYFIVWTAKGELWIQLFAWPTKFGTAEKAVLPGLLAFTSALLLYALSRDSVRRRSHEVFVASHALLAPALLVFASLHYATLLWYVLPGVLLYASDAADAAADALGCNATLERARYAHGVLTLTLGISPHEPSDADASSLWRAPMPLQWAILNVPCLGRFEAHPFSTIVHCGGAAQPRNTVVLSITCVRGGWTDALRRRLCSGATAGQHTGEHAAVAHLPPCVGVRLRGWFGLGADLEELDGAPLCLVCGGSGGTPFITLLSALAHRYASSASAPPITVHWICRTRARLNEYLRLPGLADALASCAAIEMRLHVTPDAAGEAIPSPLPSPVVSPTGEGRAEGAPHWPVELVRVGHTEPLSGEGRGSPGTRDKARLFEGEGAHGPRVSWRVSLTPLLMAACTVACMAAAVAAADSNPAAVLLGLLCGLALGFGATLTVRYGPRRALSIGWAAAAGWWATPRGEPPAELDAMPHPDVEAAAAKVAEAQGAKDGLGGERAAGAEAQPPALSVVPPASHSDTAVVRELLALGHSAGRPEPHTILAEFEARCAALDAPLAKPPIVFASGPASLVSGMAAAARERHLRYHPVSFVV